MAKRIDVTMGEAIPVADESFDPGYPLETTLKTGSTDFKMADVIRGYKDYGPEIGE